MHSSTKYPSIKPQRGWGLSTQDLNCTICTFRNFNQVSYPKSTNTQEEQKDSVVTLYPNSSSHYYLLASSTKFFSIGFFLLSFSFFLILSSWTQKLRWRWEGELGELACMCFGGGGFWVSSGEGWRYWQKIWLIMVEGRRIGSEG
jgi:hypothetical protein